MGGVALRTRQGGKRRGRRGQILLALAVAVSALVMSIVVLAYATSVLYGKFQHVPFLEVSTAIASDFGRALTRTLSVVTQTYNKTSDINAARAKANDMLTTWILATTSAFAGKGVNIQPTWTSSQIQPPKTLYAYNYSARSIYNLTKLYWYQPQSLSAVGGSISVDLPAEGFFGFRKSFLYLLNLTIDIPSIHTDQHAGVISFRVQVLREGQEPVFDLTSSDFEVRCFDPTALNTVDTWRTAAMTGIEYEGLGRYVLSVRPQFRDSQNASSFWSSYYKYLDVIAVDARNILVEACSYCGMDIEVRDNAGIESMTVTLSPIADSWMDKNAPNVNKGTDTKLHSRGLTDGQRISFLKFDLSSLGAGANMISAKVYLRRDGGDSADEIADIYFVSDDSWQENTITWNNMPGWSPAPIASTTVGSGEWYYWEVGSAVQTELNGDKTLSLALMMRAASDHKDWDSRENELAKRPYMIVTYSGDPRPGYVLEMLSNSTTFWFGTRIGQPVSPPLPPIPGKQFSVSIQYSSGGKLFVLQVPAQIETWEPAQRFPSVAGAEIPSRFLGQSRLVFPVRFPQGVNELGAKISWESDCDMGGASGTLTKAEGEPVISIDNGYYIADVLNTSEPSRFQNFTVSLQRGGSTVRYWLSGYDTAEVSGVTLLPRKVPFGSWTALGGPVRWLVFRRSSSILDRLYSNVTTAEALHETTIFFPLNESYFYWQMNMTWKGPVVLSNKFIRVFAVEANTGSNFGSLSKSNGISLVNGSFSATPMEHRDRRYNLGQDYGHWASVYSQDIGAAIIVPDSTLSELHSLNGDQLWVWTSNSLQRLMEYDLLHFMSPPVGYTTNPADPLLARGVGLLYEGGTASEPYQNDTEWRVFPQAPAMKSSTGVDVPRTYNRLFLEGSAPTIVLVLSF